MITKLTVLLLFYVHISSGKLHDTDNSDFNLQSFHQINSRQYFPLEPLDSNPDIYNEPFKISKKPCNKNHQNIFKDTNEQQWNPTFNQRIIRPVLSNNNFPEKKYLIYQSLKGEKGYHKETSDSQDQLLEDNLEQKKKVNVYLNKPESKIEHKSLVKSPYLYGQSAKLRDNKNLKINSYIKEGDNVEKENEILAYEDVADLKLPSQYDMITDQNDKSDHNVFLEDEKCAMSKIITSNNDEDDGKSISDSKYNNDYLRNELVIHSNEQNYDHKTGFKNNFDGRSRSEETEKHEHTLYNSLNEIDENLPKAKKIEKQGFQKGSRYQTGKGNNKIELFKNNESDSTSSTEDKVDRHSDEYDPTKGRGVVSMLDSKKILRGNSRVCYACSTASNPTCWTPDRSTTVKYCSKDHDACVTKVFQSSNSVVMIRDCAKSCDESSFGPKYKYCSVCQTDLCNDTNSASFNSHNLMLSLIIIYFIKFLF